MTLPNIRALREAYPRARIIVVALDKASGVLEDCPWLDQVVPLTVRSRSLTEELCYQINFLRTVRRFGCDLAIDLRTGTRSAILAFLSGAAQRIGFYADDGKLWRNRLFTSLLHREYAPGQHVVDYLLSLLESFGVTAKGRTPELFVSEEKLAKVEALFAEEGVETERLLVALQPFSLWRYKEWGKEKYIALIRWLIENCGAAVLVTGSGAEQGRAEEIVRSCGRLCYNFAGKTSIGLYAALLKKSGLFIGVDSAGLHIAAAVGTPTVSFFGPSSPDSWAPVGSQHLVVQKDFDCVPCWQKGCNNSEQCRCLEELSVAEVIAKINTQLQKLSIL